MKAKPLLEAIPPLHLLDAHSACSAAVLMLQAEPTAENLKGLRDALAAYEDAEFCN